MSRRRTIPAAILAAALFISACSGKPPEIGKVYWQFRCSRNLEKNLTFFSLSLFLQPSDPDGYEDLEAFYLINDKEELFWRLRGEDWIREDSPEGTWIGSNAFSLPDGSPLPAGDYRILLEDLAGETAERNLHLPELPAGGLSDRFPKVTVGGEAIEVTGRYDSVVLWIELEPPAKTLVIPLPGNRLELAPLYKSNPELRSGFRFSVFAEAQEGRAGLLSGPFYAGP